LDTLYPATAGEARGSTIMARKTYSEEFRRQAVELYESTPGATFRGIAADLGITRNTLKDWVTTRGRASTASTTASTNATTPTGSAPGSATAGAPPPAPPPAPPRPGSPQAELAALRARVAALESENTLLATQRDILRQAAKYFAGETRCEPLPVRR
jgi:transposase